MESTLVAIDAGTTGVSCVLFDAALAPLAHAYREFEQHYPQPGWVEHDAAQILAAVDATLAEIAGHPLAARAAGLGITNQRETVFALERSSGRALRHGIVWQDRRTAARCAELRGAGHEPFLAQATGLRLDPYFSATKIEWMLRADAQLARRAQRGEVVFATVDGLIARHLSGLPEVVTDPTNASRTLLYDLEAQNWNQRACELFAIESGWLPRVVASSGSLGRIAAGHPLHGLPILGLAGDQQAALLGHGGTRAGALKLTFGTGCFLLLHTGAARARAPDGFLGTLALGPGGSVCHALEGSVFVGGALVQFLRDQLGFFERSSDSEALARQAPDSGGVHFVPAFAGLGAPYWDPDARGAILGLTRGTTRAQITRAALEAIAFQNTELLEMLRDIDGVPLGELRVDGGAVGNQLLMELQADYCGLPIVRTPIAAATARGAAALAGFAAGLWPGGEVPPARGEARRFEPRLDPAERARRLRGWRAAVQRVRSQDRQSG
ncbi:MAG: glycerol kinase GlpK [Planctomycetes bacterium]|nr:glycerol kinase GlpK [Planctomycetota bacterium]